MFCGVIAILFTQSYNRSLRSNYGITDLNQEFAVLRNEDIDSRTELDEAEDIILLHLITHLDVRHDAACDQTRNLTEQNAIAIVEFYDRSSALILS